MEMYYNKHYITVDAENRVVGGFSDAFRQPTETDICINEKGGYQFRINGGEENPCLFDFDDMIPLYKWDGEKVVARTEEEIEADRAAIVRPEPTPSDAERIAELEAKLKAQDELIDILLGFEEGGDV